MAREDFGDTRSSVACAGEALQGSTAPDPSA